MSDERPRVVTRDVRPAGKPGECFYCKRKLGQKHMPTCVTWRKRVKMRLIVEFDLDYPHAWDREQILFHANDSSWCVSSVIDKLQALDEDPENGCLCSIARMEIVE